MRSASDGMSVSLALMPVETTRPFLMTVMVSATSRTSPSLWEMKRIVFPIFERLFIVSRNGPTSCGVSTAVGSSRMRMSTSRASILSISTRCRSPIGRLSITASGSIGRLNREESSRTKSASSLPLRTAFFSIPRRIDSFTVNEETSLKC